MNYINEIPRAIKNGIIVPELKGYHCIHDPNPNHRWDFIWASGGFCQVYPLIKEGSSKKNLRLWKSSEMMEDLGYVARLAEYFSNHNIKYVKPYRYYEHALMLNNGVVIPGVVMDWVEGETLIKYVGKHCGEPRAIQELATQFYRMVNYLNNNNMAHGDLSGDNIIVNADGSLCLIDYDSFYVPGFENVKQSIKGTKGYRHPERQNDIFMSRTMDYFSQQVIYLSLLATARNPKLGSLFSDKELLFTESDLQSLNNYKNSKAYQALNEIHDPVISQLTEELGQSISGPLNKVKSIVEILYADADTSVQVKHNTTNKQPTHGTSEADEKLSKGFKKLNYCSKCGTQYYKSYSRYCHHCGEKR